MLSGERVKPFKWRPFDLYNDICIERYRKIDSPPLKMATATMKGNCCDNFVCNRDHYYRPPSHHIDKNDKTNPKSFLFGANDANACDFDYGDVDDDDQCESNRKSNGFRVRDNKYATSANDGDNNGVNWPTVNLNKCALLPPNVMMSNAQFPASACIGSAGSSCASSSISSLSPGTTDTNCNTTKVDNKVDAIVFRRSIDIAPPPPIVYGPLPYSK